MSDIVTQFDPSTSSSTSFAAPNSAINGALVFWNESNISLDLIFQDGTKMYLPAWYHKHKCGASGSVNVAWDVHTVLSSTSPPLSEIIVEAFDHGETFPADGPLVRQTNVGGGSITATVNQVQTLYNNGFPDATQVVSVGVLNEGTATWVVYNDGTFRLFIRTAANTYAQAFIVQLTEPYIQLGVSGHQMNVLGTFQLDVASKQINDSNSNNLVDWSAGGVFLKGNPTNHNKFNYQSDGTNTDWTLSALSNGSDTSVNGSHNTTHNLKVAGASATPDVVLITPTQTPSLFAVTAKGATTFTISATSIWTYDWVAIKF